MSARVREEKATAEGELDVLVIYYSSINSNICMIFDLPNPWISLTIERK